MYPPNADDHAGSHPTGRVQAFQREADQQAAGDVDRERNLWKAVLRTKGAVQAVPGDRADRATERHS